jgi:hypothetical protein
MAPEQLAGEALDRTVDVYGLAAVLAACLFGTRALGADRRLEARRALALADEGCLPLALQRLLGRALGDAAVRPSARQFGEACAAALDQLSPGYDESDLESYVALFREPSGWQAEPAGYTEPPAIRTEPTRTARPAPPCPIAPAASCKPAVRPSGAPPPLPPQITGTHRRTVRPRNARHVAKGGAVLVLVGAGRR